MYGLCLVELGNLASPSFTPEWPRPPYPVAFPNALRSLVPIWIPLPPLVTPLVCRQSTTDRSNTRAYRNPHIFLSFSFSFSFSSRSFATGQRLFATGSRGFAPAFVHEAGDSLSPGAISSGRTSLALSRPLIIASCSGSWKERRRRGSF